MAQDLGIETVYQNLALIDLTSIDRNFFLGREPVHSLGGVINVLDKAKINKIAKEVLTDIGIRVRSVEEEVSALSGSERQTIFTMSIQWQIALLYWNMVKNWAIFKKKKSVQMI